MNDDPMKRTVLLTGAAGRIGSDFHQDTATRYRFRLADLRTDSLEGASAGGHEVVELDVRDLEACRAACAGIDTVVHLAADPSPEADFLDSLLETNIVGTYNIFRAAADQACRRVVFASSIQVVEGYPLDRQLTISAPVRPKNMYGASKCFGEAVAAVFAHSGGLSAIAVRIGHYGEFAPGERYTARDMSAYLSRRDMVQLLTQCIDVDGIGFTIVHGVSDNRFKRLDLSDTHALLDYHPQDDAFAILGVEWEEE